MLSHHLEASIHNNKNNTSLKKKMGGKKNKGKWSAEINRLKRLLIRLGIFENDKDIASMQGQSPADFIREIESQLKVIKQFREEHRSRNSFYDFHLRELNELLLQCGEKFKEIKGIVLSAQEQACCLVKQHADIIERMYEFYAPVNYRSTTESPKSPTLFRSFGSFFDVSNASAQTKSMAHIDVDQDEPFFSIESYKGEENCQALSGRSTPSFFAVSKVFRSRSGVSLPQTPKGEKIDFAEKAEKKVGDFVRVGGNFFESRTTAQLMTWTQIKLKLKNLDFDHANTKHNVLYKILATTDDEFVDYMKDVFFPGDEVGLIAMQRLKDISSNGGFESKQAKKLLSEIMRVKSKDSPLFCNDDELEGEITKLALHTLLHPDKKVVWLGTARAVNAMIDNYPGQGTYLNCDNSKWSWELNRSWLQAAVYFGYEFKLVEQHFPDIEKAILSGDASAFIEQLVREMRAEGADKTSQYNGGDAPTATTQEILVLMDLGCVARRNSEDGSLSFYSPRTREEFSPGRIRGMQRRHSFSDTRCVSPVPPLARPTDHFTDPGSSDEIRAKSSMVKAL